MLHKKSRVSKIYRVCFLRKLEDKDVNTDGDIYPKYDTVLFRFFGVNTFAKVSSNIAYSYSSSTGWQIKQRIFEALEDVENGNLLQLMHDM